MASLKETLLKKSHKYSGEYMIEDYTLTNFVKGFTEDYKEFGEETADLYKALFMLDEDVRLDLLQENIVEITESVKKLKTPFLFEGYITERGEMLNREREGSSEVQHTTASLQDAIKKEYLRKEADKAAAKTAGIAAAARDKSVPKKGFLEIDGGANKVADAVKPLDISGSQSSVELKKTIEAAIAAPNSAAAVKILSQAQSAGSVASTASIAQSTGSAASGAVKVVGSASDKSRAAGGLLPKTPPKGILGWIGKTFGKVKNFFTGGVSSIGSAVKSGNWASLIKIPLVQGALAAGGTVLAFKLLKKLFGKKIQPSQEASLKAALARR